MSDRFTGLKQRQGRQPSDTFVIADLSSARMRTFAGPGRVLARFVLIDQSRNMRTLYRMIH